MARESIETIPPPPSSEPGQLPLQVTLSATSTNGTTANPSPPNAPVPEDSTPYQRKGHICDWISKPSATMFAVLVTITAFSFLVALLSKLGDSGGIEGPQLNDYVLLLGDVLKFDWQNSQEVSVQWFICGIGRYRMGGSKFLSIRPTNCPLPNRALDIYVDNTSQPSLSYKLPQHGTSIYEMKASSVHYFKTTHDTFSCEPQYYTPNDCYSIRVPVFAIDKETNNSIPIRFEITNFGAGDFVEVSSTLHANTTADFPRIVGGQIIETVASNILNINITRSESAWILTFFILTVNWLLTLCSIITTALVFRRKGKLRDGVALVPFTLILTIPTIRRFYPNDPPIGVYLDLVGFFPQMLSVAFCIIAMLAGLVMKYDGEEARPAIELERLQTGAPFNETVERVDAQRPSPVSSLR